MTRTPDSAVLGPMLRRALCLLAALLPLRAGAIEAEDQRDLDRAAEARVAKRADEAVALLDAVAGRATGDPETRAEALYQKGLVLEGVAKLDEALAAYGEVGKDAPGVPAAPFAKLGAARVLGKLGRIDDAVAAYDALVMAHPRHGGAALLERGKLDEGRGRTADASSAYRLLLRTFPNAAEAKDARRALDGLCGALLASKGSATGTEDLLARGECLMDQERYHEAQQLYERVLAKPLPPEPQAEVWMALGAAWDAQDRPAQAASAYRRVVRLSPGTPRAAAAQMAVVQGFLDRSRWRDAVRELDAIAKAYPGTPQAAQAWYLAGTCEESLKDRRRAEDAYRKVLELAPQSPWAPEAQHRLMRLMEQPR